VKKSVGTGIFMVITTVVMFVPPIVAHATGYSAVAGALVMPTIAAFLPALMADVRTAVVAAVLVSVSGAVAIATAGDPVRSGATMAGVALLTGLATRWGRSKNLMLVPITVGFVICLPPSLGSDRPVNALIMGVATLAAALWGVAAGWFLGRGKSKPAHQTEAWPRTWAFAITLAILTGVAAGISIGANWGHAGAWFIMTVVLVFQPYLQDAFQRTWQRAAGTVAGVVAAFVIHLIVPWPTVELILGEVLLIASILVISTGKYPYWFFTALITPAIVLLAGSSGNFAETDAARLVATLCGVGLAFLAELLLTPLYRAGAKKQGRTHF
jgi:hypothetical protein